MIRTFWLTAMAALALCLAAGTAEAAPKGRGKSAERSSLAAIRLECFKQYGAWWDAEEKKWVMRGTIYNLPGKVDAVNDCIAQRTGLPRQPFMMEKTPYPPPRY